MALGMWKEWMARRVLMAEVSEGRVRGRPVRVRLD